MFRRAFHIGLAVYLVAGISGVVPVVSEVIAGADGDCCSECGDPTCPERDGRECPPQCDECVCPCWVAPLVFAAPSLAPDAPPAQEVPYITGDVTLEPPVLRGVFRPPRLSPQSAEA